MALDALLGQRRNQKRKSNVRIAIVGAGTGGCACAYFLEDVFLNEKVNNGSPMLLEIDLYEKGSHLGGRTHKFTLDHQEYELNEPTRILSSDVYMNHFLKNNNKRKGGWRAKNDLLAPSTSRYEKWTGKARGSPNGASKKANFYRLLKFFRYLMSFVRNRFNIYKLQDEGFFFSNVESFLRKLNPEFFTLSQLDLKDLIVNKCQDSNLACNLSDLVHSFANQETDEDLPGIFGLNSLVNNSDTSVIVTNNRRLCENIVDRCKCVRVKLNCHVKLVAINDKQTEISNKLKYELNGQTFGEEYDFVVIAFPLSKDSAKESNFFLDILNKSYLNFEMSFLDALLIDGKESRFLKIPENINLMTICLEDCKFFVEVLRKTESTANKRSRFSFLFWLNTLVSRKENVLDHLFEPGFKIIDRVQMERKPLFANKSRRAILGFPQIIIDDSKRARIFHLNSFEWVFGSMFKECNCIAARNISFLIGQKALKGDTKIPASKLGMQPRHLYQPSFFSIHKRALMIGIRFLICYLSSH